eukprot:3849011-Amphidinium_carterae.1
MKGLRALQAHRACSCMTTGAGSCTVVALHPPGHSDEVLDVCFNSTGNRLVTASADCTVIRCTQIASFGHRGRNSVS